MTFEEAAEAEAAQLLAEHDDLAFAQLLGAWSCEQEPDTNVFWSTVARCLCGGRPGRSCGATTVAGIEICLSCRCSPLALDRPEAAEAGGHG